MTNKNYEFPTDDAQIYWATLHYARWWMWEAPIVRAFGNEGLSAPLLRQVAKKYNVDRWVRKPPDDVDENTSYNAIIALLNQHVNGWPDDLLERAQACIDIAENASVNNLTKNRQYSAITKFSWFMQPENWTLFDKYARLGLQPTNNTVVSFYEELQGRNFVNRAETMNDIIQNSEWNGLFAGRILDTMLLFRGGMYDPNIERNLARHFLETLPEGTGASLNKLAKALQNEVGNQALLSNHH